MAWTSDKSEKGTPGLLFRQRLEYGIGNRQLAGDWKLLWSMHSHQASMNPDDVGGKKPENCPYTLNQLLKMNDKELKDNVKISRVSSDSILTDQDRDTYTLVLAECLKRIDEINTRGNLLESVKASEGRPMPS